MEAKVSFFIALTLNQEIVEYSGKYLMPVAAFVLYFEIISK